MVRPFNANLTNASSSRSIYKKTKYISGRRRHDLRLPEGSTHNLEYLFCLFENVFFNFFAKGFQVIRQLPMY